MHKQENTGLWGAMVTVLASLTLSDWGVILGILFGLATLLMNWYYKEREMKLKEQYFHKHDNLMKEKDE
jgi:hypothetical protein